MNKYLKLSIGISSGAILGFGYYYFFGCTNGCPLTSKWYVTTLYGAFSGLIVVFPSKKKEIIK